MLHLRNATIADLPTLLFWDKQAHVIAADPNDDWNWETELSRKPDWREQLIAEREGKPIGFIQIIDPDKEETHYWGKIGANKRAIDIWIGAKNDLGKGYGTIMMKLALDRCFADPEVDEVLIDPLESNQRAIHFYRKIGFAFVEKRSFGKDRCEVYSISRQKWQNQG
jgi:aminoglycoside 6'-N-acetyltransferase